MKVGDLVSFSDLTINNTLCAGTGIILEVYPAKPYDYPTYLVEITVVSNKYVDSFTYQTICYADSWGMTITIMTTLTDLKTAMLDSEQALQHELSLLSSDDLIELASYDYESLSNDDLDYIAQQSVESLTIVI
jgi:hypothetical protein